MFGNPEVTPGGRALKFYSSVRMDVRRIETIKTGTDSVGNRTRIKIVKNKVAPPFKEAEVDIMYGLGISKEGSMLDVACSIDVIEKSGAWFSFNGQRIGQGRENAKQFLKENPDVMKQVETKIKENKSAAFMKSASAEAVQDTEE
jgi:recombination protein RecA